MFCEKKNITGQTKNKFIFGFSSRKSIRICTENYSINFFIADMYNELIILAKKMNNWIQLDPIYDTLGICDYTGNIIYLERVWPLHFRRIERVSNPVISFFQSILLTRLEWELLQEREYLRLHAPLANETFGALPFSKHHFKKVYSFWRRPGQLPLLPVP